MEVGPRAEQLVIPAAYGAPSETLGWDTVDARLAEAAHYWLSTVRPDGRPHAVPLDGLWLDAGWYFGGSAETVKHHNLLVNRNAVLHLEDADAAVIVEGECLLVRPDQATAERLAGSSKAKYGYGPPPSTYLGGVWRLEPTRVLAWTELTRDATRFLFDAGAVGGAC